jgi:hypothetical protein
MQELALYYGGYPCCSMFENPKLGSGLNIYISLKHTKVLPGAGSLLVPP